MSSRDHVKCLLNGHFRFDIKRRWESRTERYYVSLVLYGGLFRKELLATKEITEVEDLIRLLQQGVAQAREWERSTLFES